MFDPLLRKRAAILAEIILAAIIVVSVGHVVWFFRHWGYLPQPYIFDTNDTFMDWFNTAYWANNPGAYDVWRSVYPPLSFVFLRVFSLHACYQSSSFFGRDCDWLGRAVLFVFYGLNIVLVFRCYWKVDRRTAVMRSMALSLGLPMLFALERGNLIIPCFTFFVLGHGRILRSAWLRWFSVALTINFKPYLAIAVIPQAVRRRWRWLEGSVLATMLVYLVTYALQGGGSPMEILKNSENWIRFTDNEYWGSLYYSTSYTPLITVASGNFPLLAFVGSRTVETWSAVLPWLIRAGQLGVLISFAGAWFRPDTMATSRMVALSLAAVLTTTSPGGYAEVFLLFLVFMEPWQGPAKIVALTAAYLLCISADYVVVPFYQGNTPGWLGGRVVFSIFGVSLGQLVRPALLLTIQYALVTASLANILRHIRRHDRRAARWGIWGMR